MAQRPSSYQSPAKRAAPSNPVVLGARSAAWVYWGLVGLVTVLIVGATCWLLTHPLTA